MSEASNLMPESTPESSCRRSISSGFRQACEVRLYLLDLYAGKKTLLKALDDGSERLTEGKAMSQKEGKLRDNWKGLKNLKLTK